MKNDNFDFIKNKLDAEQVSAPEALSEENVKARLEKGTSAKNIIKFKPNNKRFAKGALSIAAAIALVVVSLTAVNHYNNSRITEPKDNGDSKEAIIYFTSYDEIDKMMKSRLGKQSKGSFLVKNFSKSADADIAYESSSEVVTDGATSASPSHSETYKQVDAVDEADIVKTDGEYIYLIREDDMAVIIYSAENGITKRASTIHLDDECCPQEMFLSGDNLVVISTKDDYDDKEETLTSKTSAVTYDITDKSNPKKKYEYSQSGYYSSSRMIGDCVYLVTNFSNNFYVKNRMIPCATDANGEYKELPCEDICAIRDSQGGNYAVIGAFDAAKGDKAKQTKAVIGSATDIYCNENNIYITSINYNYMTYYLESKCTIVKYSLDKTKIKLVATGKVRGNINNQFSMDEKDGFFRIATTAQNKEGRDINILYVLDDELNEVGRVNGFAKNEHIEAVRFIGDMAYVITYERTDPLFIIDLSDPRNPEILGEVKISGFSTMLVPIDDKTLLGIGYATEDNEFGETVNGLKLALFDISNPAEPAILDEKELNNIDSPAQFSHKALCVNSEKGYFAIPAYFSYDEESMGEGALVFSVENGSVKINKKFISRKITDQAERCLYIENFIYVVDSFEGVVDSFEM